MSDAQVITLIVLALPILYLSGWVLAYAVGRGYVRGRAKELNHQMRDYDRRLKHKGRHRPGRKLKDETSGKTLQ